MKKLHWKRALPYAPLAAVCVCFAAYIMYTHRKQEDQGGGQR